jgi:adenine specific DNA methylase Mod
MSNIYEQRFFSALKDTFIGHPIKGKSGYVNLMDLKAQYFAEIEPYIKKEIDKQIETKYREELFEKLFNFFDCYLNETGTVFFANSQIHKNLYEKVYSDRDDVALFWKTQKLYYVKSEANYEDLQTEVNGIKILFDASEIKHAKGNEKKAIQFYLVKATKEEVVFKIRYQESNKYDRLKDYLELDKNNDLIDKCLDDYGTDLHPNIIFANTDIDRTVIDKKTDSRKCLFIENLDDALSSVKVEYSINDLSLMLTYLHKKGIILYDEDLRKIFSIYKRQNEIDYFIHKDAEGFLKEQFDIYVYNWLFNDLDTDFDAATVKRIQNIKKIAHKVIEYIARFEDELKAIWEKPKFVRNCNYVLTLDKFTEDILKKVLNFDLSKQLKEWKELQFVDDDFNIQSIEKDYDKFRTLPIDTKNLTKIEKYTILSNFDNLHQQLNGVLIKSDNWQALNTISDLFKNKIDLIYIDPPFNTGNDFDFKDKYQDTTWLTLMDNKLQLSYNFLNDRSNFYMQLDHIAEHYGKILLDRIFGVQNFMAKITWNTGDNISGFKSQAKNWIRQADFIHYYRMSENYFFRKAYEVLDKNEKLGWLDIIGNKEKLYKEKWVENKFYKEAINLKVKAKGTIWNDIYSFQYSEPRITESFSFVSNQKPENLLRRIIQTSCEIEGTVLDFFNGSGTTTAVAHKLNRKYIGIEMGEHFGEFYFDTEGVKKVGVLGRMKIVIKGDIEFRLPNTDEKRRPHLTKDLNWQGGGFFKYYELEQYEEVLSRAKYQWKRKDGENQVEQYSFMQDQKLLDAIEIDYKNKNAKVVFENLYPDVDIAETLSNVSGKHIKQIFEDKVVFEDGSEVVYAEMTFEKYPWIKPLIWWNSK